ncbi:MAG: response regulator [Spirochaetales bacterium]|nr:response regulator [Spirochaetales bacterium]
MKNYHFTIGTRLALNFSFFLIVILIFGGVFLFQITKISSVFRDFYEHPYAVSNTVREIETDIIRMHRAMKDLALSETQTDILRYSILIDKLEEAVLDDFSIVYDRYLGDKTEVDEALDAFREWSEIRNEVFRLKTAGNTAAAAALTSGAGAVHVEILEYKIAALVDFAERKAGLFYSEAEDTRKANFSSLWLLCALALILGSLITITATRSITVPLLRIVEWIREISTGKLIREISLDRRDEIGTLADSCRRMQENLTHKSEIAKMIAAGDFSERVVVGSADDEVALSINQIADNYSKITTEYNLQNWLKTGQNLLNEDVVGVQESEEFSRKVVSRLCNHLGAQIGAFYIADAGTAELRLSGSYALNLRTKTNNVILFGEGLEGQCAIEKKCILITEVPEDFFKIETGSGDCAPVNVAAFPILYEGELIAVIELGSINKFTSRELSFLELTADIIGTGLNSVMIKVETEKLLLETQRQSTELSAQQDELCQSNEELEQQAKALRASEATLQMQQEELRVTNEELEENTRELKSQKDTLKKKNNELDRAMKEIAVKAEDLRKSSSYKSEFIANMSNELRTPLNSIMILSKLLSRNADDTLSDKEKEFAETIYSSGSDLLHLINEILDLSKIEAGKMEILNENFSIKQLLSSLTRSFQQIADEKAIEFILKIEADVPRSINSDLKRVEQILKNLLSNSFKFTKSGSVILGVKGGDSGMVRFYVTDTGIGIPKEKQKLIFEAFRQADGTTSRQYGGTGLGLSISLELSKLLGGELEIISEEGKGSEFSLYLPDTESSRKLEHSVLPAAPGASDEKMDSIIDDRLSIGEGDRSVLIIEDDPVFAKVVLDFARKKEFKGIIAPDGETGLHFADYYTPSAIILDIGLPGIDGWEVMERLKSSEATRYIPVHFLTAGDDSNEAYRHGAVGFLHKPVKPEDLDNTFGDIAEILVGRMKKLLLVEDDDAERRSLIKRKRPRNNRGSLG